jgi:hypothetical protein
MPKLAPLASRRLLRLQIALRAKLTRGPAGAITAVYLKLRFDIDCGPRCTPS